MTTLTPEQRVALEEAMRGFALTAEQRAPLAALLATAEPGEADAEPPADEAARLAMWAHESGAAATSVRVKARAALRAPVADEGLDVERLKIALAAAMDPTAYDNRDEPGRWTTEWRKALSWADQYVGEQASIYARLAADTKPEVRPRPDLRPSDDPEHDFDGPDPFVR